jgi:hypothetical protein
MAWLREEPVRLFDDREEDMCGSRNKLDYSIQIGAVQPVLSRKISFGTLKHFDKLLVPAFA